MKSPLDIICNSQLPENECPALATCVERSETSNGDCKCKNDYVFNPNYTSKNDYCIKFAGNKNKQSSIYNSKNIENASKIEVETTTKIEEKSKALPGPQHIIAGVFIPVIFVFTVLGGIFAYKKLHISQHIRNVRRTHRTRYSDVMLGSNDNDDPPLI